MLVKRFKYEKLTPKVLISKIKNFDQFFTPAKYQQLTSQALQVVGMKNINTATVMTILAEQCSKKGQQDKAVQYITRAHSIATEVLDGVTNHKKFIGILNAQATIALRQKKYQEALDITAKLGTIAKEVYGPNQTVDQ